MSGNFDSLAVQGAASVAGSLSVNLGNGVMPTSGNAVPHPLRGFAEQVRSITVRAVVWPPGHPSNAESGRHDAAGQFTINYSGSGATLVYQPLLMLASLSADAYNRRA